MVTSYKLKIRWKTTLGKLMNTDFLKNLKESKENNALSY